MNHCILRFRLQLLICFQLHFDFDRSQFMVLYAVLIMRVPIPIVFPGHCTKTKAVPQVRPRSALCILI